MASAGERQVVTIVGLFSCSFVGPQTAEDVGIVCVCAGVNLTALASCCMLTTTLIEKQHYWSVLVTFGCDLQPYTN